MIIISHVLELGTSELLNGVMRYVKQHIQKLLEPETK